MNRPLRVATDRSADRVEIDDEHGEETKTVGADEPSAEPLVEAEEEAAPEPEPFRCKSPQEAQQLLKEATTGLAKAQSAIDELVDKRDAYNTELEELDREHEKIAADAIGGNARAQSRIEKIAGRKFLIERALLPTAAMAIAQAREPLATAASDHKGALAELHRFEQLDLARALVDKDRQVDDALAALRDAFTARQAAIQRYARLAETPLEIDNARRLMAVEPLNCAWAAVPGLPVFSSPDAIPPAERRPLAESDATLLGLEV
jgi:hypothetical protein